MILFLFFSGNLYHGGELGSSFPTYTQGDYITVILDMENKTLSFAKNGEDPQIAFHNVDAPELFPCVLFYSNNPGEKVVGIDLKRRKGVGGCSGGRCNVEFSYF